MGNESRKVQIKPSIVYQSKFNQSENTLEQKISQLGLIHKKIKCMQPGPVIFLPDSVTGPDLKTIEIKDFSQYIKAKRPSQIVICKETRGADYSKEVSPIKIDQNLLKYEKGYKSVRQRPFALKLDNMNGVSIQTQILALAYKKKLQHYHQKPERTTSGDSIKN